MSGNEKPLPRVETMFGLEPPLICHVNVTAGSLVSVLTSPEPTREAVIPSRSRPDVDSQLYSCWVFWFVFGLFFFCTTSTSEFDLVRVMFCLCLRLLLCF